MLHGHNLNHVEVGLLGGALDGKDGIDNVRGELLGEGIVQLGGKRRPSDREEEFAVNGPRKLEIVEELEKRSD